MTTAEFEKDEMRFMDLVNDPDRQADIDARYYEKEANKERFHAERNGQRRDRILFQAGKYLTVAIGFALVAGFAMEKDVAWLAWGAGAVAVMMALVSSFGFGRAKEIVRNF